MTDQPTTETRVLERTLSHRLDSKPVTVKSMWRGVRAEQTPLIEALREALRVATFESHLEHSRHFPEADR